MIPRYAPQQIATIFSDASRLQRWLDVELLACEGWAEIGRIPVEVLGKLQGAHIDADIAALCLSLLALWISARPASGAKTFGYQRAEILGALFNGLMLWVLVIFVWFEAAQRLLVIKSPDEGPKSQNSRYYGANATGVRT